VFEEKCDKLYTGTGRYAQNLAKFTLTAT